MSMRLICWFPIAWIVLAGPVLAQDKATIEKMNAAFTDAFNNGDFASAAALYTEDAYVLAPGAEILKGRGSIQSFWAKAGESLGDVNLTTLAVTPLGPSVAREIGTFSGKTKGSEPQDVSGKYVVIWQKVGDDWKMSTDIWNSNK
ncbi:MAG TPA: nuclear transport factor 2 family protein [Bradyrhizobium sp.]